MIFFKGKDSKNCNIPLQEFKIKGWNISENENSLVNRGIIIIVLIDCSSPIFTRHKRNFLCRAEEVSKTSKTYRLWILKIPPSIQIYLAFSFFRPRPRSHTYVNSLFADWTVPTISKNFRRIDTQESHVSLNVALPHNESLSRDLSGTLAWYDWRTPFSTRSKSLSSGSFMNSLRRLFTPVTFLGDRCSWWTTFSQLLSFTLSEYSQRIVEKL